MSGIVRLLVPVALVAMLWSASPTEQRRVVKREATCAEVEAFVLAHQQEVVDAVDAALPVTIPVGFTKSLVVDGVAGVEVDGCAVSVDLDATIDVRWGSDTTGTISLGATFTLDTDTDTVCIVDPDADTALNVPGWLEDLVEGLFQNYCVTISK